MNRYKPTTDLLMKTGRVQQFWKSFIPCFQNEKTLRSNAGQSSLTVFQNRELTVFKKETRLW